MAQLKDHLTALSKPAEDEEEGETRLEREFNVRVWLHVHTVCVYAGQCSCHACSSHLPVTPAQLMRPGIGRNASCTVGDFA